jgi:hypothetical protein
MRSQNSNFNLANLSLDVPGFISSNSRVQLLNSQSQPGTLNNGKGEYAMFYENETPK